MYSDWVLQLLVVLAVFLWLCTLTFLFWKERLFLKTLFPKNGERDIRKKFEEVIKAIEEFKGEAKEVNKRIDLIEENGLKHIQRVELLRYNPYEDTGGDQSFSIAILDKKGSGVMITSLHTRSGTRVFSKPVDKGKAVSYQFSKEEEQVIENALREA